MKERVKEYLRFPYSTYVVPDVTTDDEPCYVAYHPELPGCMSHGCTVEEALNNLIEVTELYISTLLDKGLELPVSCGVEVTWHVENVIDEVVTDIFVAPSVTPPSFVAVS